MPAAFDFERLWEYTNEPVPPPRKGSATESTLNVLFARKEEQATAPQQANEIDAREHETHLFDTSDEEEISDTNSSFDRLECILDEMETAGGTPKPAPTAPVVVDLNDTEHDAPTTEPGHNYMFDPEKAMDPPFLKNSEILARLSQEELELVESFYERGKLLTTPQRHDLLKTHIWQYLPILRCPHCGSRVAAKQLFKPKSGLFPSGFYLTCCYDHAMEDKKRVYLGGANLGRLLVHPADCPELDRLQPRSGQRADNRQPLKKSRTENRTLAHYSPDRATRPAAREATHDDAQSDRLTQIEKSIKDLQDQLALVLKGLSQLQAVGAKDDTTPANVIAEVKTLAKVADELAQKARDTVPEEAWKPAQGKPSFAEVVRRTPATTANLPRMRPHPNLQKLSIQGHLPAPQTRLAPVPDVATGGVP